MKKSLMCVAVLIGMMFYTMSFAQDVPSSPTIVEAAAPAVPVSPPAPAATEAPAVAIAETKTDDPQEENTGDETPLQKLLGKIELKLLMLGHSAESEILALLREAKSLL